MNFTFKYLIIFIKILLLFDSVTSVAYNVIISTDQHVNQVDSKFLSFTIDPKYLFSSSEKFNKKHCMCMASSLSPAYIRIAGPSTSHMVFNNSTISIEETETPRDHEKLYLSLLSGRKERRTSVSHKQWGKFVRWTQKSGFDLMFALNNEQKMASGMWDPNSALNALTMAEKANVTAIAWQLGYECVNQSIEEYLNDLETLRVIVETFHPDKSAPWRVVAGDVTSCLQAHSKSDFKDFVTLSNEMLDAIFLNGNSSAQQLEKMSDTDRQKLLRLLSNSDTPLWLTEKVQPQYNELERAADWLASLGYSARNGFSVHFRELMEEELHGPTLRDYEHVYVTVSYTTSHKNVDLDDTPHCARLESYHSFYMALLYKSLVGERVLDVDMRVSQAAVFAHCAALRRRRVPGALTLYGANLADEPARFSFKMSKREDGGDIMQFIFGHDSKGNIVVNGRAMYLEGDIIPVVKRVRPFKTLLLNLPPKSFGFWVLANTNVEACFYKDDSYKDNEFIEAVPTGEQEIEKGNVIKTRRSTRKRSLDLDGSFEFLNENYTNLDFIEKGKSNILRKQIETLNNELKNFHDLVNNNSGKQKLLRFKRQTHDTSNVKKLKKKGLKTKFYKNLYEKPQHDFKSKFLDKLLQFKNDKLTKLGNRRFNKRTSKRYTNKACSDEYSDFIESGGSRRRRSVNNDKRSDSLENNKRSKQIKRKLYKETFENEVDTDDNYYQVENLHNKPKGTVRTVPIETEREDDFEEADRNQDSRANEITLKTKLSDDEAVINISEKTNHGLLRSTLDDVMTVLADFNKNFDRFWSTFTLLEDITS